MKTFETIQEATIAQRYVISVNRPDFTTVHTTVSTTEEAAAIVRGCELCGAWCCVQPE